MENMITEIVEDIFTEGFESVRDDDTLSTCLSLFKGNMPPVLAVLVNEGKYRGVVARRWIIRSLRLALMRVKSEKTEQDGAS